MTQITRIEGGPLLYPCYLCNPWFFSEVPMKFLRGVFAAGVGILLTTLLVCGILALQERVEKNEGSSAIPARYREIPKSKLSRLVEVWGAPEQETSGGHTSAVSNDGKRALFVTGGVQPLGRNLEDADLSFWKLG